ncbi:MAG: choice-of-anchor J domain-containing protein [Bacteroidales bacterium]|nr:choice-of-anchor J domain-containing protein [Bacteroidales bacterium]
MSKKLILFLMVLFLGSTSFLRADELTVHDGTATNSYVPVYGFYADAYLKCEMVFPAAELADMENGTITGMTFYAATASASWGSANFQVFVSEVSAATISDFAGPGTVVYEGPLSIADNVMNVVFATPYEYQGGNLLVGFYNTVTGSYVSCSWNGEAVDGSSVQGYNYSSLSSVSASQRNFLPKTTFTYTAGGPTPPTPPTPTGELVITPNPFDLGVRPTNGWMEPYAVTIYNGAEETTINGTISNTSGQEPFALSQAIEDVVLATEESLEFTIDVNENAADGTYAEEFTLFYTGGKSMVTIPVTATYYTAGEADIVETAKTLSLSYTSGVAEFSHTPADLHPNYFGYQGQTAADAVYQFTLAKDAKFSVSGGEFIGIFNKVANFHPTLESEPVAISITGEITEATLLAGQYYMIVAGDNITTVEGMVEQFAAPTEITNIAPANFATNVAAPVTLTWEGGDNAAQYQVLFGTSPVNMTVAQDWTIVDENYGSYTVTNLTQNTQYFWQIKVKNSNGTVTGPRWGFTSTLIAPNNVTASETEIFTDESTLIKWKLAGTGGFTGELTVADGTVTNSYVPVYGLWADYYTRSETIYPAEMLEEMEGGEITSLVYYLSSPATGAWAPDVFEVYMMEVDATTLSSYYTAANAQIVYSGYLDGTNATMTIELDTPYSYNGGNLLVGIQEIVKGTYKSATFTGITATGASASGYNSSALASVTFNQRNFIPKTTFVCGGKGVANRTFEGFNLYYGDVKVNDQLITENKYNLSNLPYNMEGHEVAVSAVYSEGESSLSDPVIVNVSGYGTINGTVTELISGAPVADVTVKFSGKDEFNNSVSFEAVTDGQGFYTMIAKAGNYTGKATLDGMEPAYGEAITLAYDATETVEFVMHESYNPVKSVYAEEMDPSTAKVTWSMTTTISGGGNGGGTNVGTLNYNFDGGMEGWTNIDANNDGYVWVLGSACGGVYLASGASLAGTGHNSSNDMVCSGSYSNATNLAITPDNYLVSPQKAAYGQIKFWACAQDASYAAEHYGVAVSTTGNTSAADFTTVAEWTMTSKGSGINSIGRDGETRAQGNWYEKTVDLSSYAGQDIWVAIRHFNCNDMFILNVDDVELSGNSKDRGVNHYAVYRKAILKEGEVTPADSILLSENETDTLLADFDWNNVEAGLYQYGVSAIYPMPAGDKGNRDEVIIGEGATTNSYVPTYNLYNYSCTDQIYTAEEIGGAGTINSIAFMPATVNAASRNLNIYMVNTDKTSFSGATDWIPVTDADLVYSGNVNWVANEWSTIQLTTPFSFDGTNLCIVVNDLTGSWTTSNQYYVFNAADQAIRIYQDAAAYNPAAPGNGTVLNVKNQIKLDITYGGGGQGGNDNPVTPITWSNVLPKDMETTVTVNGHVTIGSVEGATATFTNNFENLVITGELDENGTVTLEGFRKGEYTVTVELEGFESTIVEEEVSIWDETTLDAYFTEIFAPVDELVVSGTGYARWTNVIPQDRVAEKYSVKLNNVYQGETTDNYMQLDVTNLTVGQTYTAAVAVIYTTGMSAYTEATFTLVDCSSLTTQVEDLEGYANCTEVVLAWNGGTPTPGPGPTPPTPTPPTGETTTFDDGTMQGWTTIDANNDGYNWVLGSQIGGIYLASGASLAGSGHNSSADLVCSGSFSNATGAAITPDNYLVSPAKAEYTGISFYACAQDASYAAEHYGVAVSTTGNTSGADFTTIAEWTMTAKSSGANSIGRDGKSRAQGSWYEKTVDLSAYAGQEIWVAIRHFNCNDMFILNVDDITLGVPQTKRAYADAEVSGTNIATEPAREMWDFITSFNAAEGGQYGIATDGEFFYTSNWGYSSAAHNFWKYDQNGNQIEGFEIAGCGTLRGMAYDGDYFYGVANAATVYCVDLANHALVSTFTTSYGAMRCITYDPVRDGFWVVGNWSGNLTLIDRTGAIQQVGPEPSSASDVAYYKDANGEEHVYVFCQPSSNCLLYDYNITTGVYSSSPILDFSSNTPGCSGSSGGCFVGNYNGMTCFFGNSQQSPNLIGIYELGAAGPSGGSTSDITPNKFNIFRDGEVIGATADSYYVFEAEDFNEHVYEVIFVDANYNFSCPAEVTVAAGTVASVTDLDYEFNDPAMTLTWNGIAESYKIWAGIADMSTGVVTLDVVGETTDMTFTIDNIGTEAGYYVFVVQSVTGECESDLNEELANNNYVLYQYDLVPENEIVSAIYPNPTSGDVNIKAEAMKHISVYNAMGQMVYDQDVDTDEMILNMGQYESGVYMINIVTENGTSVKRITVTK